MTKTVILPIIASVILAGGLLWGLIPATNTPDPPPRTPNVIFITIDTLRADHVGAHGYHRDTTPNIDQLASEGVLFENCISASSWTYPSLISMFTGLLPNVHGCFQIDDGLAQPVVTLAEILRRHGYRTEAIISNPLVKSLPGFDRGFDRYDDYSAFMEAQLASPLDGDGGHDAFVNMVSSKHVTDRAIAVVNEAAADTRPVFLFLLYFDPHNAYLPPPEFANKFDEGYKGEWDGRDLPRHRNNPPHGADLSRLISLYDGEIAYTDFHIGRLLDTIDKNLDPSNTIIIITSDHGESFGEHGMLLHGNSLHIEEVHVPMIWRWSGVLPAGKRVKASVGNIDIGATLISLINLPPRPPDYGKSLEPLLKLEPDIDRIIMSEMSQRKPEGESFAVALTSGSTRLLFEYIDNPTRGITSSRAFDLTANPAENESHVYSLGTQETNLIDRYLDAWAQGRSLATVFKNGSHVPESVELDNYEYERLKSLGYLN